MTTEAPYRDPMTWRVLVERTPEYGPIVRARWAWLRTEGEGLDALRRYAGYRPDNWFGIYYERPGSRIYQLVHFYDPDGDREVIEEIDLSGVPGLPIPLHV